MNDLHIKLNEIVSPHHIQAKQRGPIYVLNNSLKRNTVPSLPDSYECRLPQINFGRKDLAQMLRYILNKQELLLPDRNLLRRILVSHFDEELIHSGSRQFINHLRVEEHAGDDFVSEPERTFCFVVRGSVKVSSGGFSYDINQGGTFGEIEILANTYIDSLYFPQKTLLLTLTQSNFNNFFRYYFQTEYQKKFKRISSIQQMFLSQIPTLNTYLFVNEIISSDYETGDKIVQAGSQADTIYFLGDEWEGEKTKACMHNCLGLYEYLKQKSNYTESIYCINDKKTVYSVSRDIFHRFIGKIIHQRESQNPLSLEKSVVKTNISVQNPQSNGKSINFLRIRKVKLLFKPKLKTEPVESFTADFKFLKLTETHPLKTSPDQKNRRSTEHRHTRSFKSNFHLL